MQTQTNYLNEQFDVKLKNLHFDTYELKLFNYTNIAVSTVLNVNNEVLTSGQKIMNQRLSMARSVAWYIYKKLSGESSRSVAKLYKINHVTVCNSIHCVQFMVAQKTENTLKTQLELIDKINTIETVLKQKLSLYQSK